MDFHRKKRTKHDVNVGLPWRDAGLGGPGVVTPQLPQAITLST